MELAWHAAAIVALGLLCGAVASAATVWMVVRLIRRKFASSTFRDQLRDSLLASPAVQIRVETALREQIRSRAGEPIGALLPPETGERMLTAAQAWLARPQAGQTLQSAIRAGLAALGRSDLTPRRLVPWDLAPIIGAAVDRAMPMVVTQLGTALRERENQIRLHVALRGMVDRFLAEQDGWKRALGNFLITDRALAYLVETIATTGVNALSSTLTSPETRQRIIQALDQALASAMERPIRELIGGLAPERVETLSEQLTARALAAVREPAGQQKVAVALETGLARLQATSLGDLARAKTGPELDALAAKWSGAATAALRSRIAPAPPVGSVIREAFGASLVWIVVVAALVAGLVAGAASLALNLS